MNTKVIVVRLEIDKDTDIDKLVDTLSLNNDVVDIEVLEVYEE